MRKTLLTALMTLVWLLASPTLQLRDSGWVEVGAPPAAAQAGDELEKKPARKASKRIGSSGIVTSNQPGFHPIQPVTAPRTPDVTGTVSLPDRDPRYPNVPTVPVLGRETSQQRVARCAHQGALGGLSAGQQGAYVHNCAF
jgi:hypothetical protein